MRPSQAPKNGHSFSHLVQDALGALRRHLGMEVAFISEFRHGRRFFRYVDSDAAFSPIQVGGSNPLDESYCLRVVDGRLPQLIPDALQNAEALSLPVTRLLPVGAHISVPIQLLDGEVFGTFCCFSRTADLSLDDRDLAVVRLFAEFVGGTVAQAFRQRKNLKAAYQRVQHAIAQEDFHIAYQPIIHVGESRLVGHEALARFTAEPLRSPDKWFHEAAEVGLQEELELAAIRKALENLHRFPAPTYLSLNISPETILKGGLPALLAGYPLDRLVLELTEHESIDDYAALVAALAPLRQRGLRVAVDDAGAGYASFRHILKLAPDIIKLDASLVATIDKDQGMRALAAAVVRFAEETGSKVVAEGVERPEELQVLRDLKVNKAQGYLLGRPRPAEDLEFPG